MQPSVLIVQTYYPEFLRALYEKDAGLAELEYSAQLERVFSHFFGVGDAYSHGLRPLGCDSNEIICNADTLQRQWAMEHGLVLSGNIHDQRRQIAAAQIEHFRPEALVVFEWCPLGDRFLAEIKRETRLLVGQIASPLPADRTFAAYDLMVSSYPPIVEYFRRTGIGSEPLQLAFDTRILDGLPGGPPLYDVTFVGGFATNHAQRIAWLERLLGEIDIAVFGYGVEKTSSDSPIRAHHHGPVWGQQMYDVLALSRITLNYHACIDVRRTVSTRYANNMRLYEATGVGTCLFTEAKENLAEMFEPGHEVVTFADADECVAKLRAYLVDDVQRSSIARAGQQRTLRDHTHSTRMREFLSILQRFISR